LPRKTLGIFKTKAKANAYAKKVRKRGGKARVLKRTALGPYTEARWRVVGSDPLD